MRVAAVDIGTNTVRLLVADHTDASGLIVLRRESTITRLGAGVDGSGHLDPEAIRRSLGALGAYREIATEYGATRVAAVATSAVRDAADRDGFLEAAGRALGSTPSVISGDEEASLSFRGAVLGREGPGPTLVIDLGGGSTEFVLGRVEPEYRISVDIGSVRLTERVLTTLPVPATMLEAARAEAASLLARVRLPESPGTVVGVGGTFTTLGALLANGNGLTLESVDGSSFPAEAFHELVPRLGALAVGQIAALPEVASGRAPVLTAGAVIASEAIRLTSAGVVTISVSDILDGLALRAASAG